MKNISILGSTGTIGINTLEIVRQHRDKLKVFALVADNNWELLSSQILEFNPEFAVINNQKFYNKLKDFLNREKSKTKLLSGSEGIEIATAHEKVDIVVSAISGISGIRPTYHAVTAGKYIALANKESLVSAGEIITKKAKEAKSTIIPVDSEHSAIFQLLEGKKEKEIKKIIIPASGGPFIDFCVESLKDIDVKKALNHPVWKMGKKITIDSATLANKGLEVIEAHHLFGLSYNKISVLIHRQCIVHGMVEISDGSILAHLGYPDMKLPISFALFYPDKLRAVKRCGLKELSKLTFEKVDPDKFPFLGLAYEVGKKGYSYPAVFNTADDLAVNAFLEGKIKFIDIYRVVKDTIDAHRGFKIKDIEDIFEIERWTEEFVKNKIKNL
ncbi:MAG: 1-deoxy-D-xylulose-5-phosphate reductoisomerase [Proteobacteria bacterium]|nr:1-deoxy-D-xylulose-5-phosphate reductoisomerase [Pseudomonadota bacterium]